MSFCCGLSSNPPLLQTKNNRPMRTSQLFLQDNHGSLTKQHSDRFDTCKAIAAKRTPTLRPTLTNPMLKNPKHAAVLAESGINYEQPLSPIQVAANRAERIAKEKRQNVSGGDVLVYQEIIITMTMLMPPWLAMSQICVGLGPSGIVHVNAIQHLMSCKTNIRMNIA